MFFFRIELSLLVFEQCRREMLQSSWIILYRPDCYSSPSAISTNVHSLSLCITNNAIPARSLNHLSICCCMNARWVAEYQGRFLSIILRTSQMSSHRFWRAKIWKSYWQKPDICFFFFLSFFLFFFFSSFLSFFFY